MREHSAGHSTGDGPLNGSSSRLPNGTSSASNGASSRPPRGAPSNPRPSYAHAAQHLAKKVTNGHHLVFSDPELGRFASSSKLVVPIHHPQAVTYINLPTALAPSDVSLEVMKQFGPLFQFRPMSLPGFGRALTVVLNSAEDYQETLNKPLLLNGASYPAVKATPDNMQIRQLVIKDFHSDFTWDGPWRAALKDTLDDTFAPYGRIVKISVPNFIYHDFKNQEVLVPNAIVHLLVDPDMELPDFSTPVYFDQWNKTCEVSWINEAGNCTFCRKEGHDRLDCPARLTLLCTICNFNGHRARDCARFRTRDAQYAANRGRGPVPTAVLPSSVPPRDASTSAIPTTANIEESDFNFTSADLASEEPASPVVTYSQMPSQTPSIDQIEAIGTTASLLTTEEPQTQDHSVISVTQTQNPISLNLHPSPSVVEEISEVDDYVPSTQPQTEINTEDGQAGQSSFTTHLSPSLHSSDTDMSTTSRRTNKGYSQGLIQQGVEGAKRILGFGGKGKEKPDNDGASIRTTRSQKSKSGKHSYNPYVKNTGQGSKTNLGVTNSRASSKRK
ncbi:hypothetical protein BGZ46_002419 [Entomortierella lignicola]|nr:hypothetical protein BGZ46_002419 [Entomortierella lignicola]